MLMSEHLLPLSSDGSHLTSLVSFSRYAAVLPVGRGARGRSRVSRQSEHLNAIVKAIQGVQPALFYIPCSIEFLHESSSRTPNPLSIVIVGFFGQEEENRRGIGPEKQLWEDDAEACEVRLKLIRTRDIVGTQQTSPLLSRGSGSSPGASSRRLTLKLSSHSAHSSHHLMAKFSGWVFSLFL
ncbi:hypothetical protein KQX54_018024 [Cotesia glomerata]|uniref:Uncharacterized protein n=1 Tax=Cotesia glomerata TaxID=32391 RepID=A0AAV7HU47_COTGL|nr:hypothetical protein KQX54_018024 [Cotesia glomerata]